MVSTESLNVLLSIFGINESFVEVTDLRSSRAKKYLLAIGARRVVIKVYEPRVGVIHRIEIEDLQQTSGRWRIVDKERVGKVEELRLVLSGFLL